MKNRGLLITGIVASGLLVSFLLYKTFKKGKLEDSDPELEALIQKIDNAKK